MNLDAFWSRVSKTDSCWNWTGATTGLGYGVFTIDGKQDGAYRVSYRLAKGPIPPKYDIDHLCRNPLCVNPAHLEAVTHRENLLRGNTVVARNTAKTHCSRGHEFSGDNLRLNVRGDRVCRICANARVRDLKRTNPEYRRRQRELLKLWKRRKRAELRAQRCP